MPLVPCPECNHRCSMLAQSCPGCGHPFAEGDLKAPGYRRIKFLSVVAGLVLLGAIVMGVLAALRFQPSKLPRDETGGFSGPVMALEFVETIGQAKIILGEKDAPNRGVMRTQIYIDYAWIASYGLLFFLLSYLVTQRRCPWSRYLGWVAAVCAFGAVAFDIRENWQMLSVVNRPEIAQIDLTNLHIRDAALLKWTFSFTTMAVLAVFFFGLNEKLNRIGFFFVFTAFAGFVSLWYIPLLALLVPFPLLVGIALLAYTAWRYPEAFLLEEHPTWQKLSYFSVAERKRFPWT